MVKLIQFQDQHKGLEVVEVLSGADPMDPRTDHGVLAYVSFFGVLYHRQVHHTLTFGCLECHSSLVPRSRNQNQNDQQVNPLARHWTA